MIKGLLELFNSAKVPQAPDQPSWMLWMKSHIGEPFHTGETPTKFNRLVFSYTNCSLGNEMLPGCAATVCAALELCGYDSTRDASAISYADYGTACKPVYGCVVVIEHLDGDLKGHHHVGFLVKLDDDNVTLLGGNQGHSLCICGFSLKRNKIIATNWPVHQLNLL